MSDDAKKRQVSQGELLHIQYETHPTIPNMWKVWMYCDQHDLDLPDDVRDRMHDVASGEIIDDEPGQWDAVTHRLSVAVMDMLVHDGMKKAPASRETVKFLEYHFDIESLDSETVRQRYHRKVDERTELQKRIEEEGKDL